MACANATAPKTLRVRIPQPTVSAVLPLPGAGGQKRLVVPGRPEVGVRLLGVCPMRPGIFTWIGNRHDHDTGIQASSAVRLPF